MNADPQVKAWWHVSNINAIERLKINDHSWVHIQIVANIALKLLRQLTKHGVEPASSRDYGMSQDDAEVVVALGALLHYIGMAVHRDSHEDFSLFLAEPKVRELLERHLRGARADGHGRPRSCSDHEPPRRGRPLTLEAGVLRVADALDMAEGRSRIPFEQATSRSTRSLQRRSRASRSGTASPRPS